MGAWVWESRIGQLLVWTVPDQRLDPVGRKASNGSKYNPEQKPRAEGLQLLWRDWADITRLPDCLSCRGTVREALTRVLAHQMEACLQTCRSHVGDPLLKWRTCRQGLALPNSTDWHARRALKPWTYHGTCWHSHVTAPYRAETRQSCSSRGLSCRT